MIQLRNLVHLGKPDAFVLQYVDDESLEHLHAMGTADDLRVAGDQKDRVSALGVQAVKIALPDFLDFGRRAQSGQHDRSSEKHEMRAVG